MVQMAQWAKYLSAGIERVVGLVVIFFAAVMVVDVLFGIVSRSFFHHPFFWTEELGRYAMIYSCCLGIGIALKRGLHVGITFVIKRIPSRLCIAFDIITRISITIFLVILIHYSIQVLGIVSMQVSPTMGFNMFWVFIITPVTCILQLVFLILMTIEDYATGLEGKHIALNAHDIEF